MKRIVVLGSTGSIGRQTLDIVRRHPDRLQLVGLAAGSNAEALLAQGGEWPGVRLALHAPHPDLPSGMEALVEMATAPDVDLVVVAVAGVIGLLPTVEAIRAGKQIALASKEVLVAAGEWVMPLVREHGVVLTPIDSEHSALFQCLQGYRPDQVDELILTASGGPFRGWTRAQLEAVTVEQALNHPTWRMGGKITIDSATMMNKGLETVEARWLFDVPVDRVRIVVHPQSIVHSFARLNDGSVLGQLGWPEMRLPIQIALLHPERKPNDLPPWNPVDTPTLTFESLDESTFRSPSLARESVRIGGTMPCAMNAANEWAANAFLEGRVRFLQIPEIVESVMERHEPCPVTLEALLETDRWARQTAEDRAEC
ncbi:MAG: 1-deoxy-D-xylulose-5-phosphate reductoisomerase [Fimbriimonadaceae bacterium]|nr:1-deoxy-D-xylulose-5-phosphate reductoisomerase [Chthonomonadaceae bacterium]MCO5298232.1 1-deoxy-D-xylulose-5-phosphate reductoisomerase [Fimbriimonadaceae bacterium]